MIYLKQENDDPISVVVGKYYRNEIFEILNLFLNNCQLLRKEDFYTLLIYFFYEYNDNSLIYYLIKGIKNRGEIVKKIVRDYE